MTLVTPVVDQQGVIGLGKSMVGVFTGQPMLLLVVILNIIMTVTAAWFMDRLVAHQAGNARVQLEIIDRCVWTAFQSIPSFHSQQTPAPLSQPPRYPNREPPPLPRNHVEPRPDNAVP
jgi:hypothetical protein